MISLSATLLTIIVLVVSLRFAVKNITNETLETFRGGGGGGAEEAMVGVEEVMVEEATEGEGMEEVMEEVMEEGSRIRGSRIRRWLSRRLRRRLSKPIRRQ